MCTSGFGELGGTGRHALVSQQDFFLRGANLAEEQKKSTLVCSEGVAENSVSCPSCFSVILCNKHRKRRVSCILHGMGVSPTPVT